MDGTCMILTTVRIAYERARVILFILNVYLNCLSLKELIDDLAQCKQLFTYF